MRRKAREGIEQGQYYPEPAWITKSAGRSFWYRLLLGRPMDGQRWTDSTFLRSATRGEDHWWLRLAGWQRAAVRVTSIYVLAVFAPALLLLRSLQGAGAMLHLLLLHLLLWSIVLLPVLLYRLIRSRGLLLPMLRTVVSETEQGVHKRRRLQLERVLEGRREWERSVVLPVARTAAARFQRRYHPREVHQWVTVPRDYREPGGGAVELLLPGNFILNETARRAAARAIGERLGLKDPQVSWELEGAAPRLLLRAPVLSPELVSFSDMLAFLQLAQEGTFVMGVAGSEGFSVSLAEDSPHLALSAGSGGGKSELIKALVAQAMRWGWNVIVLDWKGESQSWAEGLPGVRYVRRIDKLHEMCVQIGEELDYRTEHLTPQEKSRRIPFLVVSEEWGVTAPLLADYWENLRATAEPEERKLMPRKSPAAQALMKLNFAGRSLRAHQLLVAQRFSARVTNGNADLRESFTCIFMTRWKSQTMKMLAPDIRPMPKKLTRPGAWLAVIGDMAVNFQAGLWTDEEAREWATGGVSPAHSPWSLAGPGERASQRANVGTLYPGTQGDQLRPVVAGRNQLEPRKIKKLSDISDDLGHMNVSVGMLRKAAREDAQGDPDFPHPHGGNQFSGYLYDVSEVTQWARNKRAREAAER